MGSRHTGVMCPVRSRGTTTLPSGQLARTPPALPRPVGTVTKAPLVDNLRPVSIKRVLEEDREVLLIHIQELSKLLRAKGARGIERIEEAARNPRETAMQGLEFAHDHFDQVALAVKSALSNTFREVAFERITLKFYKGVMHVNIKGRPGLRKILNAPSYRVDNLKVRHLAIGETNVLERFKGDIKGTALTIAVVSTIDVIEAYLSDDQTKRHDLPFTIGVDLLKTLVASLLGAAAVAGAVLAAASFGVTVIGALPVIATIGAAVLIGLALDHFFPTSFWAHKFHAWFDAGLHKAQVFLHQAGHVIVEKAQLVAEIARNEASAARQAFHRAEWALLQELSRLHLR